MPIPGARDFHLYRVRAELNCSGSELAQQFAGLFHCSGNAGVAEGYLFPRRYVARILSTRCAIYLLRVPGLRPIGRGL